MKRFSVFTLALAVVLIVSACGAGDANSTPTVDAVQQAVAVQGTIAAAAFTSVAQTQTALPTSTPQPTATITDTPVPTNTFVPIETLNAALTAVQITNTAAAVDPCVNKALPDTVRGDVKIRIDNPTKATVNVSVYLLQAGPGSECGYRAYVLAAQQSLVINDLVEGCYSLWAWNPDPKNYFMVTNGTTCVNKSQTWAFDISTNSIKLREQ